MQPDVVVCDEPVASLDVSIQAQIINLLIRLRQELELTLIFISHDLSVVRHLCDRVAIMYRGQIVESGPAGAIYDHPQHDYTKRLLAAVPVLPAPSRIEESRMTHPDELLPWQWPEEIWRGKVEQVRAGRNLKPARWKNGARCAVALSFDVDHETNELRDGGKSVGRLSWGQYGNRVGVPRILELLKRQDIPASFFVPPSPPCSTPTSSAASSAKATRSGCMAGSTR